ncbi:class I SAM-dependent methyltransferase [Halotalea alkalilenta]|uniref:Methyltransferase domain-containing protein n=1 Tax=Halotalea alkalilenta TaxID=376489 RepID=A0A172YCX0_9GAMM|nr:class I SAM-dependent methyltransferase [Halotalea alkalilenta]ANF57088.1 hypothetical protein A5892_06090 [Halotalea alkalilenta]
MTPTDAYLTSIRYPHHYQRETSAAWLCFGVEALGYQPPDTARGYRWCELGCGQGYTAALNAAADPRGEFHAVDLNAEHVEAGRALAREAGLDNLHFHQGDFGVWSDDGHSLGEGFDFIIVHGVYSWISPAQAERLERLAARWLAPGGLLYLHYMSQPGMAAQAATQRLIATLAARHHDPRLGLEQGLATLARLREAGAGFFIAHPEAARGLDAALEDDRDYLAHELLGGHWRAMHVGEVMTRMAALGCDYLGSATLQENIDACSLPAGCLAALDGIDDLIARETLKDIARNQSYRRDIYQKRRRALTPAEHRDALLRQCVARLPSAPRSGPIRFSTPIGEVDGDDTLLLPIVQELEAMPAMSFAELARQPVLRGRIQQLSPALQMLTWAGALHPAVASADATPSRRLNAILTRRRLAGDRFSHLACAGIGAGVGFDLEEALLFDTARTIPDTDGHRLHRAANERARSLGIPAIAPPRWQRLVNETLPSWRRLGVL